MDREQYLNRQNMKLRVFLLLALWTLTMAVKGQVPACDWCASNSLCLDDTCMCQDGGNPYFTCETSGYSYCSVSGPAVHNFLQETFDIWQLSQALLAQLTTTRAGIHRGVCQLTATVKYDQVDEAVDVTEVELTLKQKDFLGIFQIIAVKIKSYVVNGVYVNEISSRPYKSMGYTTPVFLMSTDQPLGNGQYMSFMCQIAYKLTSDNFAVVSIPCCGLEVGVRPDNVEQPQFLSGVYLKVDPTNNPNYNVNVPQLCIN